MNSDLKVGQTVWVADFQLLKGDIRYVQQSPVPGILVYTVSIPNYGEIKASENNIATTKEQAIRLCGKKLKYWSAARKQLK